MRSIALIAVAAFFLSQAAFTSQPQNLLGLGPASKACVNKGGFAMAAPGFGDARMEKGNGGHPGPGPRDYSAPISKADQADIDYIIRTLSDKPTAMIVFYRGSLDEAGKRIDGIHPLRFLEAIFGNDVNKVKVKNIRGKSWVWDGFMEGVIRGMNEEMAYDNVTDEMVRDFASIVRVDPKKILPLIHQRRWEALVITLMHSVPRPGSSGRYDF